MNTKFNMKQLLGIALLVSLGARCGSTVPVSGTDPSTPAPPAPAPANPAPTAKPAAVKRAAKPVTEPAAEPAANPVAKAAAAATKSAAATLGSTTGAGAAPISVTKSAAAKPAVKSTANPTGSKNGGRKKEKGAPKPKIVTPQGRVPANERDKNGKNNETVVVSVDISRLSDDFDLSDFKSKISSDISEVNKMVFRARTIDDLDKVLNEIYNLYCRFGIKVNDSKFTNPLRPCIEKLYIAVKLLRDNAASASNNTSYYDDSYNAAAAAAATAAITAITAVTAKPEIYSIINEINNTIASLALGSSGGEK